MDKLDLKRELSHLYRPSAKDVVRVEVPPLQYLMIDGAGDPNGSQDYAQAIEALFALSYALKFAVKKGALTGAGAATAAPPQVDYAVMPPEGLWWADDMTSFTQGDRELWKWTMMILQPDFIAPEMVAEVAEGVRKKKDPPALAKLRFETLAEGAAAQIMHIGPFSEEGPAIERVHAFIAAEGCAPAGKHHEIYLSDIRRADPAKWKTVIRQPME